MDMGIGFNGIAFHHGKAVLAKDLTLWNIHSAFHAAHMPDPLFFI
jgi:hypothetical protein